MTKQGNYVPGVGNSVNWASGLSGSLSDLSKSLLAQGVEKDRLERAALAEEEAKRRYELDRADTLQYRADQRAYQKQRDELADARQSRSDAIAEEERQRKLNALNAREDYFKNYNPTEVARGLLAENSDLQQRVNAFRQDNQQQLARNALIDVYNTQGKTNLTEADVPTGVDAVNELLSYRTSENEAVKNIFNNYINEVGNLAKASENYVLSNMPLYQGEVYNKIYSDLTKVGVDPTTAARDAEARTKGLITRKEDSALALADQKARQSANEKVADIAYKIANLNKSSLKPFKIDEKATNESYITSTIDKLDPGWIDKSTLQGYAKEAIKQGVDPRVVNEATKRFVEVNWASNDLKGNKDDFLGFARSLEASYDGASSSREVLDAITPRTAAYIDPVQRNREAYLKGIRQLGPDAVRLALKELPLPEVSKEDNQKEVFYDPSIPTLEEVLNAPGSDYSEKWLTSANVDDAFRMLEAIPVAGSSLGAARATYTGAKSGAELLPAVIKNNFTRFKNTMQPAPVGPGRETLYQALSETPAVSRGTWFNGKFYPSK